MSDVTLETFFHQFAAVNPFLENRVNGPATEGSDVEAIHQGAFNRLLALARQVQFARQGLGAVLWGEAGIGKSHVLARLARWAADGHAYLVYLHNLQAAPDALPRSLLYAAVNVLTGGRRNRFASTPLHQLVRAGLIEAAGGAAQYHWSHLESAFQRWLDSMGTRVGNRLVYEVLFAFFHSAFKAGQGREDGGIASLAVRWLAGGALDPAEARHLGLPPARHRDDPVLLEDAQQIKQVLVAIARLAQCQGRPFILALDQVDNLDTEQFAALTRFQEALLDTAPNLLVITTGIQDTLNRWFEERIVQTSAWDRIAQFKVLLPRLTPAEAETLIRARVETFRAPFAGALAEIQASHQDPLFPLGRGWANRHLQDRPDLRPRDAISLAREAWHSQQERLARQGMLSWVMSWPGDGVEPTPPVIWNEEQRLAAIDRAVADEMATIRDRFHRDPGLLPSDHDRTAGLLHELLTRIADHEVARHPPPRPGAHPTYHLSLKRKLDGSEHITGIRVMATGAATSVAGFLRRLCEDSRPLDRLLIVTDERIGMPLGEKGSEYLEDLKSRGPERFAIVELRFAELADLEGLTGVLGRARAGDVEIAPPGGLAEQVTMAQVIAAPSWQKRAREHRLFANLMRPGVLATTTEG
jgi:hypothetical protein